MYYDYYCKYCGKEADTEALERGVIKCSNCGALIDITDGGQSFFKKYELEEWEVEGSLKGPVDTTLPDVPKTHIPNLKPKRKDSGLPFHILEDNSKQRRTLSTRSLVIIFALVLILVLCSAMVIRHSIHKNATKEDLEEITPTAPVSDSADLTEPPSEPAAPSDPNAEAGETNPESVTATPADSWETVYCSDPVSPVTNVRVEKFNGEWYVSAYDVLIRMGYMEKAELIHPKNYENHRDIGFCNENYESAALPYAFAFRPDTGIMWVRQEPFEKLPPAVGKWGGTKIDLKGNMIPGEKMEIYVPAKAFITSEYIKGKYITEDTSSGEVITIRLMNTNKSN